MPLQKHQIISIDLKRWNRFEINELLFDCRFLDTILYITRLKIVGKFCAFYFRYLNWFVNVILQIWICYLALIIISLF